MLPETGEPVSLQLMKTYDIHATCIKNIELVSDDLILFNMEVQSDQFDLQSRPYHWRYDFGNFPPLDIAFDSETGLLKELTIFIRKKNVVQGQNAIQMLYVKELEGYPTFDIEMWAKHEYYHDEDSEVIIVLEQSSVWILLKEMDICMKLSVNHELAILFNAKSQFAGFVVNHLEQEHLHLFRNK